jgi:diguanylate cyclase (GGDEF)-like protein
MIEQPISGRISIPVDQRPEVSGRASHGQFFSSMKVSAMAPSIEFQSAAVEGQTKRPRILVIDDESWNIELLGETLGSDYEVLFAMSGLAALEIASARAPDVILLDVKMPGMDGFEVCRRLKANPVTCEIPVIFITGSNDVVAETKGLELGAADYITKPINPGPTRSRVNTQVKLKRAQEKLAHLAATDGLTGLANRSSFDECLGYEYARHARSGTEMALIMLDIDHFKAFNDTYGHVCGDDCLRQVAHAIRRVTVRATDKIARYGGEEFVFLLPETHMQGALLLAERIRLSISDLAMPHIHSSHGHVTASLGVACCRIHPGKPVVDIVTQADIQLYAAKASGRNCVAYEGFPSARPVGVGVAGD